MVYGLGLGLVAQREETGVQGFGRVDPNPSSRLHLALELQPHLWSKDLMGSDVIDQDVSLGESEGCAEGVGFGFTLREECSHSVRSEDLVDGNVIGCRLLKRRLHPPQHRLQPASGLPVSAHEAKRALSQAANIPAHDA